MRVVLGVAVSATMACACLSLSGCGGLDDLARVASQHADDASALARTRWVPRSPNVVVVPAQDIRARAGTFLDEVSSVPTEERAQVVQAACEVWNAYDIEQDPEKVLPWIRDRFPNAWAYREQVRDLARDFEAADSSTDRAVLLGRAAVCAAADQVAGG